MASSSDLLVWIDCEMTGLDVSIDELVEVAVVITDYDLNAVDPGFQVVIKPDQAALDNMGEFVTAMHRESGLLDEIPNGRSLADAEFAVNEYILGFVPTPQSAPLAGNTIGTDRAFLAKYMPRVDAHLHYRNIDVSSIKELCPALVPARVLQRARQGRRASRPRGHPRVDPRARLLPRGGLRAGAGAFDRTGAGHLGGDRDEVRRDAVIHWTSLRRSAWWS